MADQKPTAPQVQSAYQKVKAAFEAAFKEFHKDVFLSKILDANKSPAKKTTESHVVETLLKSAVALDGINTGEGLLALSTTCLRELLTMRDRVNELEYQLLTMVRDFNKMKKDLGA